MILPPLKPEYYICLFELLQTYHRSMGFHRDFYPDIISHAVFHLREIRIRTISLCSRLTNLFLSNFSLMPLSDSRVRKRRPGNYAAPKPKSSKARSCEACRRLKTRCETSGSVRCHRCDVLKY
jgi:hypothetical protein